MSEQNRKYYSRGNEILKDEIVFKISNNSDQDNKFLVEKIETKDKKKFIKQYKLNKGEINYLITGLQEKNIKIISSELNNLNQIGEQIINNKHPEYINGHLLHLDSYRKTITAKFDEDKQFPYMNMSCKIPDNYEDYHSNYSQIN